MSVQASLKRYLLVLERVKHGPTFAELRDHLEENGLPTSERTLQRAIEQIRVELGLEIVYDRPSNTYHLPAARDDRDTILPLLERAVLGGLLNGQGGAIRSAAPHIQLEHQGRSQGLHHWGALLRAIDERRETVITYRRFQHDREMTFKLRPCLLKEHRGRWYVLGTADGYEKPISLGLDRILTVQLMARRFPARERQRLEEFYEPVIGVDTTPGKAVDVLLRFTPLQGKYVKALPLHSSQQLVRDDADGVVISLHVLPNFELKQEIMGLGPSVVVLAPATLVAEIRHMHEAACEGYAAL
jgi:predicted DNA-binding transcriptional regulator YafY